MRPLTATRRQPVTSSRRHFTSSRGAFDTLRLGNSSPFRSDRSNHRRGASAHQNLRFGRRPVRSSRCRFSIESGRPHDHLYALRDRLDGRLNVLVAEPHGLFVPPIAPQRDLGPLTRPPLHRTAPLHRLAAPPDHLTRRLLHLERQMHRLAAPPDHVTRYLFRLTAHLLRPVAHLPLARARAREHLDAAISPLGPILT